MEPIPPELSVDSEWLIAHIISFFSNLFSDIFSTRRFFEGYKTKFFYRGSSKTKKIDVNGNTVHGCWLMHVKVQTRKKEKKRKREKKVPQPYLHSHIIWAQNMPSIFLISNSIKRKQEIERDDTKREIKNLIFFLRLKIKKLLTMRMFIALPK